MSATQDVCRIAREHIIYENLDEPVRAMARGAVMDGVANMLAGSREPLAAPMLRYVNSLGARPTCTVVGRAEKVDPLQAALVNAVFCHSMDFELMWYPGCHPTSPTLGALLAVAELVPVSGRDAMAALVAGFEVQGQIMRAIGDSGIPWPNGVHAPGIVGPLGAAVTSGKLLGLGEDELRMALGIAGSRIGSLMANIGTMTKSTHTGNAARMGLESALLAAQGFTASPAILESKFGVNEAFFQNALDMDSVAVRLGNPYRMVDPGLVVKKYPCQYPTHWSIDAAIEVVAHNSFRPSDISSVVVEVGADNVAAQFWELNDGLSGKFSVAYTVAAALLDGTVGIESFRDARLQAEDMQKLLPLIEIKLRPDVSAMDFAAAWSTVTVELSDGRVLTSRVDRPLGIWDNPIPWDLWVQKYQNCAATAVPDGRADAILERIEDLDEVEDLGRDLVALLGAA